MKKYLLLCLFFLSLLPTTAQRRQAAAEADALIVASQAMTVYDFDKAIDVLERKIEQLKKKRKPALQEEELLELARKNKLTLSATEVVTIIDSVALPKQQVLSAFRLGGECGSVESYAELFNQPDSLDRMVFINQLRNKILFAAPNQTGHLRLYQQELIGKDWKESEQLEGLVNEETENVNYPFLMDDGITLYFAAQREEGLGGYDIYMTRYDTDERTFLTAENVGMPFNSPANDYLMVIDEYNELGYFVTDRNQAADSVCVYTFIPNATRQIYQEGVTDNDELRSFARIECIANTWTDKELVAQAQERLRTVRSNVAAKKEKYDFEFILNDERNCYTINDFKKDEAKTMARQWVKSVQNYEEQMRQLQQLRIQYAQSNNQAKSQLAPQIRIMEKNTEQMYDEMQTLAKKIRQIELARN